VLGLWLGRALDVLLRSAHKHHHQRSKPLAVQVHRTGCNDDDDGDTTRQRAETQRAIRRSLCCPREIREEGLTKAFGVTLKRATETAGTQRGDSLALKSDDEAPTRRSIFVIEETAKKKRKEKKKRKKKTKTQKKAHVHRQQRPSLATPHLSTSLRERRERKRLMKTLGAISFVLLFITICALSNATASSEKGPLHAAAKPDKDKDPDPEPTPCGPPLDGCLNGVGHNTSLQLPCGESLYDIGTTGCYENVWFNLATSFCCAGQIVDSLGGSQVCHTFDWDLSLEEQGVSDPTLQKLHDAVQLSRKQQQEQQQEEKIKSSDLDLDLELELELDQSLCTPNETTGCINGVPYDRSVSSSSSFAPTLSFSLFKSTMMISDDSFLTPSCLINRRLINNPDAIRVW